jgi:hypothetical protein
MTGMPSLLAASAPATVEFVSPRMMMASGFSCQQHLFHPDQHRRGLACVAAGTGLQVVIRCGCAQFVEERLRHGVVVVLAGMHQNFGVCLAQRPTHRRRLHKFRASADDRNKLHVRPL